MVHCFTYTHKGNPLYFVWDVESGSLHNVDEAAFLVSKKRYQQLSDDENERFLKLSESDLEEIDAELDLLEKDVKIALANSKKGYLQPCDIWHLEDKVKNVLSIGNQTGEGWFLTAEMIEYIENGIPNIVCVQPFACLPNHVVGKGVIKTIRNKYPEANISPIDYDPGASEANQTNRLKLLMTVAKDNLKLKNKQKNSIENEKINTIKI